MVMIIVTVSCGDGKVGIWGVFDASLYNSRAFCESFAALRSWRFTLWGVCYLMVPLFGGET